MKESQKEIKEDIKESIEPLVAPPDDLSKPSYVVSIDFSNSTDLYNGLIISSPLSMILPYINGSNPYSG